MDKSPWEDSKKSVMSQTKDLTTYPELSLQTYSMISKLSHFAIFHVVFSIFMFIN